MPLDQLCTTCSSIDFKKHLRRKIETSDGDRIGPSGIRLGILEEWCPFCRLVQDCVRRTKPDLDHRTTSIYLTNTPSWSCGIISGLYGDETHLSDSNRRDLRIMASACGAKDAFRFILLDEGHEKLGELHYLADGDEPVDRFFFGRRVDPRHANLHLANEWLRGCEVMHGNCYPRHGGDRVIQSLRDDFLRVVDVKTRLVVPLPENQDFIALTYVWGKAEQFKISTDRIKRDRVGEYIKLPDYLPWTIEDAITVVQMLGKRYLWVDALCILQDESAHRASQITKMDVIYSNAWLTIADASGDNADAGLAGISRRRIVTQHIEYIDGLPFSTGFPEYIEIESDRSIVWNTRGWTFQENLLSKRLLLFTDYQVYLKCGRLVFSENLYGEILKGTKLPPASTKPLQWDLSVDSVSFFRYLYAIENFSERKLTKEDDRIQAVRGVLNILQPAVGEFHAGIPENYFTAALIWQPLRYSIAKCSNDAPFPSWSWAKWHMNGGLVWETRVMLATYTHTDLYLINRPRQSTFRRLHHSPPNPRLKQFSHWAGLVHNDKKVPPPIALTLREAKHLAFVKNLLYFYTETVSLVIGDPVNDQSYPYNPNEFNRMTLLTPDERKIVGYISLSGRNWGQFRGQVVDNFIMVCWGKGYYDGPPIDKKWVPREYSNRKYFPVAYVMLVRWNGAIAERLGLGLVVSSAWTEYKNKREWVMLG